MAFALAAAFAAATAPVYGVEVGRDVLAPPQALPALPALPQPAAMGVIGVSPLNAAPERLAQLETIGRPLEVSQFEIPRLPLVAGSIEDKAAFSQVLPAGAVAQSLPIKRPGSAVILPPEFLQFQEVVDRAVGFERLINKAFDGYHIYMTVAQGEVEPGASQKRPNAHTDGFPRDAAAAGHALGRTYLASDAIPTEFFNQPFPAPDGPGLEAHSLLDRAAKDDRVVAHEPYTLTAMDAYTVHRSPIAPDKVFRTFVKLHFSLDDFKMAKNTPNPLLDAVGQPPPTLSERLAEEWANYNAGYQRAAAPVVTDPKGFTAELFNMGKAWWAPTILGPRVTAAALERPARRIAKIYFSATPELARAAGAFVDRVLDPKSGDSENQRRKAMREGFLAASYLNADAAARALDALPAVPSTDAASRRQASQAVLAKFEAAVRRVIAGNVAGVIVAGSYVEGTAKPDSDLDMEVLTRDGSARDVPRFLADLVAAAPAGGWPGMGDRKRFANVMGVDGPVLDFMRERPSVLIMPGSDMTPPPARWTSPWLDGVIDAATRPALRWWARANLP